MRGKFEKFGTADECFNRCHPDAQKADVQHCPGGEPVGVCVQLPPFNPPPGHPEITPPPAPPPCPKGSYCESGFPVGLCCDEKLRDKAEKDAKANKAECPKGKKLYEKEIYRGHNEAIRGKTCEHDFCPKGSKCVQKKTAFCCL